MIFKRNEQIPSFCLIHGIPMKPFQFRYLNRVFIDYACPKCQSELDKMKKKK